MFSPRPGRIVRHIVGAARRSRSRSRGAVYASRRHPRPHGIQWIRTGTRPITLGAFRGVGSTLWRVDDEPTRCSETVARNDGFDRPRDLDCRPASPEVRAGRNADIETERSGKRPRDRVELRVVGRQAHERRHTGRTPLGDQPNATTTAAGRDPRPNDEVPRIRATLVRSRCPSRDLHVYPPVAHCRRATKVELDAVDGRHGGRDNGQHDGTDVAGAWCARPAASDRDSAETGYDEKRSRHAGNASQVSSPRTARRLYAAEGGRQGLGMEGVDGYYPDSSICGAGRQLCG